jgi:hypothetical protein
VLATALAQLEQSDLRGRLAALAASAASEDKDDAEVTSAEVTSPEVTSP